MTSSKFSRRKITSVAALLAAACFVPGAYAAQQKLSDLSYVAYHEEGGSVIVDTSGQAKLRITFESASTARVEIAPSGTFKPNLSPAIEVAPAPAAGTKILDSGNSLVVQNAALTLRIDKTHLRVDAYDAANGNPISLESPDDGTAWDTDNGQIRQSRLINNEEHLYGLGQDNANRGTLDRRGTLREMWTGQQIRSGMSLPAILSRSTFPPESMAAAMACSSTTLGTCSSILQRPTKTASRGPRPAGRSIIT